jgi:hypothetical protein
VLALNSQDDVARSASIAQAAGFRLVPITQPAMARSGYP